MEDLCRLSPPSSVTQEVLQWLTLDLYIRMAVQDMRVVCADPGHTLSFYLLSDSPLQPLHYLQQFVV